jgi:aryl-alcohol dehydrogenase-like predicted oxidoreductase
MERVPFGSTGLTVSRLGLGCGGIGDARVTDDAAERLVLSALDAGIVLFDCARSYGLAEERLGRILGGRRESVVLSTKGGYGATGEPDWTAGAITTGIDEACARLRTDRIDIFHLHSCPLDVLRRDDLHGALTRARDAGKIRVAAYSGDDEALHWAVEASAFGSVQCSVSVFDQQALASSVPRAAARGLGVIAKRPLGNAPWRFTERPSGQDAETSWDRMRTLDIEPTPAGWIDLAARFTVFAPGVSCAIVGTTNIDHLAAVTIAIEKGPLPLDVAARIRSRFIEVGSGWPGKI